MRTLTLILLTALATLTGTAPKPNDPADQPHLVYAITHTRGRTAEPGPFRLAEVAVWSDGLVIHGRRTPDGDAIYLAIRASDADVAWITERLDGLRGLEPSEPKWDMWAADGHHSRLQLRANGAAHTWSWNRSLWSPMDEIGKQRAERWLAAEALRTRIPLQGDAPPDDWKKRLQTGLRVQAD